MKIALVQSYSEFFIDKQTWLEFHVYVYCLKIFTMSSKNITDNTQTGEHKVPIWMLSPSEEKNLLKEHQIWAEKQCEAQYDSKKIRAINLKKLVSY